MIIKILKEKIVHLAMYTPEKKKRESLTENSIEVKKILKIKIYSF